MSTPLNPSHTSSLVLSLVVNGHNTDLTHVIEVTGCTIYALKDALPLLKAYMFKCGSKVECIKLIELTKAIWSA